MELTYGSNTVLSSEGVQTTNAFGIARTPHMFNILSSGLYSDKIAAVLREISCNAMDAHIMGNCPDKPFQVKLPTSLDRSFYVKDWGPGLDDREVRELYTTYGWSSKQSNNDVTGAFGLGSKSPFAYTMQNEDDTDGFTVVAVKDGVKRIYTCHIGDEGAPAISRLFEGPADADWQHGVMVTFPVQQRDIPEFHRKAREIFRWFKVKPEVLGLDSPVPENEFKFTGSFFNMKLAGQHEDADSCVITGNVRYPINAHRLGDLTKIESALLRSSVHLFLPIGQVMMTPSREELQYTERTKENLKLALGKAALEVANRVRDDVLTPEPTKWEWFKKIHTYHDSLPYGVKHYTEEFLKAAGVDDEEIKVIMDAVKNRTTKLPSWVGHGIAGPRRNYLRDDAGKVLRDDDGNPRLDPEDDVRGARVWLYTWDTNKKTVRRREVIGGRVRNGSDYAEVNIDFLSDITVFYNDSNQADARVRGHVRNAESEKTSAILVMPCVGTPKAFAKEHAERICGKTGLDGVPCVAASTLTVPGEVEAQKLQRKLAKEQGARVVFAGKEVPFMTMDGNVVTTTLGDVEEESDMFYVCATKPGDWRHSQFRNHTESAGYQGFGGYYRAETLGAIAKIAAELDLPLTGMIVIGTEGQARKFKLAEQGFKPFLPWFIQQVKEKADHFAKLGEGIDRTPQVDLTEMWRADDFGWLGIIGHHKATDTPFWKRFKAEFHASPFTAAVEEFVAKAHVSDEDVADREGPWSIASALNVLDERITHASFPKIVTKRMSAYEVRNAFRDSIPSLNGLNETVITSWMVSDVEKAIEFLRFALSADGLLDGSKSVPLRLVA